MCTHFAIFQRTDCAKRKTVTRVRCHAHSASSDHNSNTSTQTATPTPNVAVLDKLITVFASKSPIEWRKLIAHSKQWPQLSGSVLARCNTVYQGVACTAFSHAMASNHVAVHVLFTIILYDACDGKACDTSCSTRWAAAQPIRLLISQVLSNTYLPVTGLKLRSMQNCRAKRGRGRSREEGSLTKASSAP